MKNFIARAVSFNPGAKYLILFNNPDEPQRMSMGMDIAFQIFTLMYKRFNVANVIILYAIDEKLYNIYYTDPYHNKKECGIEIFKYMNLTVYSDTTLNCCRVFATHSPRHL